MIKHIRKILMSTPIILSEFGEGGSKLKTAALIGGGAALAGTESGRNAVKTVAGAADSVANNAAVWKASQAAHANGGKFTSADGTTVGRGVISKSNPSDDNDGALSKAAKAVVNTSKNTGD